MQQTKRVRTAERVHRLRAIESRPLAGLTVPSLLQVARFCEPGERYLRSHQLVAGAWAECRRVDWMATLLSCPWIMRRCVFPADSVAGLCQEFNIRNGVSRYLSTGERTGLVCDVLFGISTDTASVDEEQLAVRVRSRLPNLFAPTVAGDDAPPTIGQRIEALRPAYRARKDLSRMPGDRRAREEC